MLWSMLPKVWPSWAPIRPRSSNLGRIRCWPTLANIGPSLAATNDVWSTLPVQDSMSANTTVTNTNPNTNGVGPSRQSEAKSPVRSDHRLLRHICGAIALGTLTRRARLGDRSPEAAHNGSEVDEGRCLPTFGVDRDISVCAGPVARIAGQPWLNTGVRPEIARS